MYLSLDGLRSRSDLSALLRQRNRRGISLRMHYRQNSGDAASGPPHRFHCRHASRETIPAAKTKTARQDLMMHRIVGLQRETAGHRHQPIRLV